MKHTIHKWGSNILSIHEVPGPPNSKLFVVPKTPKKYIKSAHQQSLLLFRSDRGIILINLKIQCLIEQKISPSLLSSFKSTIYKSDEKYMKSTHQQCLLLLRSNRGIILINLLSNVL